MGQGPSLYVVKNDFAETWDQEVIRRLQCITSINIIKKIIDSDRLQLRISCGQDVFFIEEYRENGRVYLDIHSGKWTTNKILLALLSFMFPNRRKLIMFIQKAVLEITETIELA
jgi:hypothetical protein